LRVFIAINDRWRTACRLQADREMTVRGSARCAYPAATGLTSVSRPSDSVVGRGPREEVILALVAPVREA
jgi:hypothetical protein